MAKLKGLTAEIFSRMPDEMQQEVLNDVGAENLNNVLVFECDTSDPEQVDELLSNLLLDLNRAQALFFITWLLEMVATPQELPEVPEGFQGTAKVAIIMRLLSLYKETKEQHDKDKKNG